MNNIIDFILKHPVIGITFLIIPIFAIVFLLLAFNPDWNRNEIRLYCGGITVIYIIAVALFLNGKNIIKFIDFISDSQLGNNQQQNTSFHKINKTPIYKEPTFIDIISMLSMIPVFIIFYFLATMNVLSIVYSFSMPFIIYSIIGIYRKRIRVTYFVATGFLAYIISIVMIFCFTYFIITLRAKI